MTLLLAAALALGSCPARAAVVVDRKAAKLHFLRGLLLQRRGSEAEALDAFEMAFSADPTAPTIGRQAAELALEAGLSEAAKTWVSRLEGLDGQDPMTEILRGRLYWSTGETDKAQAAFEAALKLNPKSAESILSLGSLLSGHAPDKARALFERFIKENPDRAAEAHHQIALLDEKAGKPAEAVKRFNKAIELEPASTAARYGLAQFYETRKATDAALAQYLEIARLETHNVALLNHIGEMFFLKGQIEEARARFLAVKTTAPSDPTACQWLSAAAEQEGDFPRAAAELSASSAIAEDPALNLRLSYYLTQAGQLKEAVAVLEKAHARWPANEDVSYFLALGYDDLKATPKAVALLREVVVARPDFRDARYQLAILLEKSDRLDEAEVHFRELLARKPDDAGVLNYLGYSLADRGLKLAEAAELAGRAAALDPKNGAYQDSLGWAYFKLGRLPEAAREIAGASRKLPRDPTILEHLGDVYEALGVSTAAWRSWRRAQALDAGNPKPAKKAAALEKSFSPEELGGLYVEHWTQTQGGVRKLAGLAEVSGTILGRSFRHSGVVTFRGPDELDVDLLGPLFTPFMRVRLRAEGFSMDPVALDGIDPETLSRSADAAFTLVRDYLSGRLYGLPGRLRSGWRQDSVEVAGYRLTLDADGRLASAAAQPSGELRLDLSEFSLVEGRQVPGLLSVSGKGFSLSVRLRRPKAEFLAP